MSQVFDDEDFVVVKTDSNSYLVVVDMPSNVLVSPNGTRYLLKVDNSGALYTVQIV